MARLKHRCPACGIVTWHDFGVTPGNFRYHCRSCGKVHRETEFREAEEREWNQRWELDGKSHGLP